MSGAKTIRELITKWGFKVDTAPLDNAERAVDNLKSTLKKVVVVAAGVGAALGGFLNEAGKAEQINIAFETMLKSGEKARQLLQKIEQFAASTPFELPTLQEGAKKLTAFKFGVGEIIGTLKDLGNIAAGIGMDKFPTLIGALGKIKVKGKASMEELNMMLEAGVPILDQLSTNLGVNNEKLFKMISTGKIAFTDVRKALGDLSNGSGTFAGLMEKQSKSFFGIISNIKDVLGLMAKDIGMKLLPEAKKLGKEILGFIEKNKELLKLKIGDYLKSGIVFLKNMLFVFGAIKNILSPVIMLMGGLEGAIRKIVWVASAFVGLQMAYTIGTITQATIALALGFRSVGAAAALAQVKALAIPILIGLAVLALAAVIEDIIGYFQGRDSVTGIIVEKFSQAFEAVKAYTIQFGKDFKAFIIDSVIGSLDYLDNKFSSMGDNWKILIHALLTPFRQIINLISTAKDLYGVFTGKMSLSSMGSNFLNRMKNNLKVGNNFRESVGLSDGPGVNASEMLGSNFAPSSSNSNSVSNVNVTNKNEIIINKDMDESVVRELIEQGTGNALKSVFSGVKNNFSSPVAE